MTLYLREELAETWCAEDPWRVVSGLEGRIYREAPGRVTMRFSLNGRHYFLKRHNGVGWREIAKNLLQARLPVIDAGNEWRALQRLQALGIPSMQVAAYGVRGLNPAQRESFIITDALDNTQSLETVCAAWVRQPPEVAFKRQLIEAVAGISRVMHQNGVCHRDYYLCHFLLHLDDQGRINTAQSPVLSLIDLHRALIKPALGSRWVEKDIAGLYYSAMRIGLTRRDLLRFVRMYTNKPLRRSLSGQARFWQAVQKKAHAIARRDDRKWQRALYRSSEQFRCEQSASHHAIVRRDLDGQQMRQFLAAPDAIVARGEMLKAGDSTTVVKVWLDGQPFVAKRYNLMGPWHRLRRLFQPSRAWRCWGSAHRLLRAGISTPAPVAMVEERHGPLRGRAWYLSEFIDGEDALYCLTNVGCKSARWQSAMMQFRSLFSIMQREHLVHGDMKATNFLLTKAGLVVLDLDACRQVEDPVQFRRRFNKDLARFLRNWSNDEEQHLSAKAMVRDANGDR